MHVSTLRSGFKAAEGGGPPSRLLGINVMGGEVLSYFLCNWPSRSRNLSIGRFPARLQKPLKGRGHKVLTLWFAQQPLDGGAGIKLDLSQPLELVWPSSRSMMACCLQTSLDGSASALGRF